MIDDAYTSVTSHVLGAFLKPTPIKELDTLLDFNETWNITEDK